MVGLDPSKHRILLIGQRVIHLKPFFEQRHYNVLAVQKGVEGMGALDAEPRDIVILELNLVDLTATEFLMAARQAHPDTSFLLLDDAAKAGQIVKALQAGLDGYLPTPPDEDRLFFEVERHLSRAGGDDGAVQARADDRKELTELRMQLADRDSQLVETSAQTDMHNAELRKLREEAKKLNTLRGALVGQIEGDLDEAQVTRLRERLAMASVVQTEADTLREELDGARNVRRELQAEIELLKKRVQERSLAEGASGSAGAAPSNTLEADNMALAGRVGELEEELDLKRAAVLALERKLGAGPATGNTNIDQQEALVRLRAEHESAIAALTVAHDVALNSAVNDLKVEKASTSKRMAEVVALALKSKEKELSEKRGGKERFLRAKLDAALADIETVKGERDAAVTDKDAAVEKGLDIELILDELKVKSEYFEAEVEQQRERANKAESDVKKSKQLLMQQKEVAPISNDVSERVQRFMEENATLKHANTELEKMCAAVEDRAKRAEELSVRAQAERAQAAVIRAEAILQRDTAESARTTIERRALMLERQLADKVAQIASLTREERARRDSAARAVADADQAALALATAPGSRSAAAPEGAHLKRRMADAERIATAAVTERDEAEAETARVLALSTSEGGGHDALVEELRARIAGIEEAARAQEADARKAREASELAVADGERERAELITNYQARLREGAGDDALPGLALPDDATPDGASDAVVMERDEYRERSLAAEGQVQQAQLELEALRAERDQLAIQAAALEDDVQSRGAETEELSSTLKDEVKLLRTQLQQARQQMQPGPSGEPGKLPEELEPLRWTLTAAIEALTSIEPREPAVGSHLRNLRLLASTLQKLNN
jgi:DNA-binding response OmpR family regulator